jgi:two-component system nitrate/nitrite response regulator NarL
MMSCIAPGTELTLCATPVDVLVVDDQLAIREGLAQLIASAPHGLRIVGSAATSAEALLSAARLRPKVVVLDVDLAGEDGLALIPQLAANASVLVLSSHGDPATRARAARLGARAFIEKHQPAAELLHSIASLACLKPSRDKTTNYEGTSAPPAVAAPSVATRPVRS